LQKYVTCKTLKFPGWRRLFFETPFDFSPDAVSKLGRAALRHALIVGELNQRPVVGAAQKAKRPIQRSELALTQKRPFGIGGINHELLIKGLGHGPASYYRVSESFPTHSSSCE